jgi:hypothetical protein
MERIKAIQQEILHLEVFKKLGELPSATRLYYDKNMSGDIFPIINIVRSLQYCWLLLLAIGV